MSQELQVQGGSSVTPTPSIKLPVVGGNGGDKWDDGVYDRVTKVYVGRGHFCIGYIKFEYEKDGKLETKERGLIVDQPQEFVLDPNEYVISVEGTTNYLSRYNTTLITSLTFKTSMGRTSPSFGFVAGEKFVIRDKGREIVGFHGQAGDAIDAIGAYSSIASKLPAQGGSAGDVWDHGAFDNVRKVYVGNGHSCIGYLKFEYEKNGIIERRERGMIVDQPVEFALDQHEHIVSMEGNTGYIPRYQTTLVTSLMFRTSTGRTSPMFGFGNGKKFILQDNGRKVVGFHGRSGDAIDALGTRSSITCSPIKLPVVGGDGGDIWDDGVFDRVTKLYVGNGHGCIGHIKFEYSKNGKLETRERGWIVDQPQEFLLNPNEYIISVEGTTNYISLYKTTLITSLTFKTSRGRTSPTFGFVTGERFVIEDKGREIVGFHGQAGEAIDALGIYSSVVTKLPYQGGPNGDAWDHGAFDSVRKVYVGEGNSFIGYIKFEYAKNGKVETYEHGTKQDNPQEFVLEPYEYITSVEGTQNYVDMFLTNVVTSLAFKTSRGRVTPTFGAVVGTKFVLEDNGRELVGFHGRAGDALDALGAYVFLGTNTI